MVENSRVSSTEGPLEGETTITVDGKPVYVQTGREWAGEVILAVGSYCQMGRFPKKVSAFDLGRALGRAVCNCDENDPHAELIKGLKHWQNNRDEAERKRT